MSIFQLIVFTYFITHLSHIHGKNFQCNIIKNDLYYSTKNKLLRLNINENNKIFGVMIKEKFKNKITNTYNSILSKLYDINGNYHALPEDDKRLIDLILSNVF